MNDISPSSPAAESAPISRHERREAQRREQRASGNRRRTGRRALIWLVSLTAIVGLGWGMVKLSSNVQLPSDTGGLAVPVNSDDVSRGPADAPITLVEYSDFQCPACRAYQPVIDQLLADPLAEGKVRFVYRHFPLPSHKNGRLAARAAQAAHLQGKFWEFHDALFEGQDRWAAMSDQGARDVFRGYAQELQLDVNRWENDLDSDIVKRKIDADVDGGIAASVNATPTFFVNGARMPQVSSYEQFRQTILNSANANP